MILLNSFSHGFFFGLGFILACFGSLFIIFLLVGRTLTKKKKTKARKKLTKEMLDSYLEKISNESKFEEATTFKRYIEDFKNKKPMDEFFKEYTIAVKMKMVEDEDDKENDEDSSVSFFGNIKRTYYIKKREK